MFFLSGRVEGVFLAVWGERGVETLDFSRWVRSTVHAWRHARRGT